MKPATLKLIKDDKLYLKHFQNRKEPINIYTTLKARKKHLFFTFSLKLSDGAVWGSKGSEFHRRWAATKKAWLLVPTNLDDSKWPRGHMCIWGGSISPPRPIPSFFILMYRQTKVNSAIQYM